MRERAQRASEAARAAEPAGVAATAASRPASRPAGPERLLVVNADDFGTSTSVNTAVIDAHRRGVLRSASLMVTGAAADEAVAMARAAPGLAVGLHLVLVQGRAASTRRQAPDLVDDEGRLPGDPVAFGLRLAFDRGLQRQVASEIEAQLALFAATGLPLSHVDGHLNFHMHPAVFPRLARAAAARGAHAIRVPRDDLRLALRHGRGRLAQKLVLAAAFGLLGGWARRRLPPGLRVADRVYGLFQSGTLSTAYVLDVIARLPPGTCELYGHPATDRGGPALGPNPTDLATLCDPAVAAALRRAGVETTHFSGGGTA